jgi:uncharacterized protein (TIGR00297 family)
MSLGANLLFGLCALAANAAAGYAAFGRRSVSGSGAVAGATVGTVILVAGGFLYWIMLMLFFVSSSVASRVGGRRKERLDAMHERGSRRDAVQVVANGGLGAVAVLALRLTGEPAFALAAAAAFASVNADTWASEIGVLSRRAPRSILTRKPLEPGTSGGVSPLGTAAAAVGSLLIAGWFFVGLSVGTPESPDVVVWAAGSPGLLKIDVMLAVFVAGLIGTTVDSLLGALVQAQYRASDGSFTERPVGEQGPNERVRGFSVVNNDVVNLLSSLVAATVAGVWGWAFVV